MSVQEEAVATPPRPTTRLGRYELITRIGQGGMAEVQLALQRGPAGFEKLVVVKLVHESLATQKAFVDMLLDEARVAALVKHPNVVDIYDLGQAEGRYFIAMEYLEGEPMLAVLRAGREGKRLDPLSTGRLIADTAEGLDAAHELRSMSGERLELVHHDISLGNIVVLYNGQVKLVDFGVAKATQSATKNTKVQGKFSYMAPEKLRGSAGDRRSDIFSLGCVMWEALTLKRLFRGGNDSDTMKQVLEMEIQPPSAVNSDVPAEYDPIVMRALDRDPDKRHATAKEMAVEIEELLRQRGYGAKNDRIGRYMQDAFRSHIDARKKLVQEVVSKGSASAEVLDAAFSDANVLASGSPVTPTSDFQVKYRRVTPAAGVPIVAPPLADSSRPTEVSPPPIVEPEPIAAPSRPPTAPPVPIAKPVKDDETDVEPLPTQSGFLGDVLADPKKRIIAAIAAGAVVLLIVLIVATGGKHDGSAKHGPGSGSAGALGTDPSGAPADAAIAMGPADAAIVLATPDDAAIAAPPDAAELVDRNNGSNSHVVTPPKLDAAALFKQGLQEFVKGDSKGALAVLQKARTANPSYPPTWRLMGQIYEKQGDHGNAKSAYLRYLSLAPSAPDAPTIREKLNHL